MGLEPSCPLSKKKKPNKRASFIAGRIVSVKNNGFVTEDNGIIIESVKPHVFRDLEQRGFTDDLIC